MSAILIEEALERRNVNNHAYIRGAEYYSKINQTDSQKNESED
jgi:hypothetical protein